MTLKPLGCLSAAVLAALTAILAVVLPAGIASAAAGSAAGNRVWAISQATHDHAGADRLVPADQHRGEPVSCPFHAPGACAAPEGDLAGAAAGCGLSFSASTPVLTASGKAVAISKLRPGDKVIATDVRTGQTGAHAVSAVLVNHDADLFSLKISSAGRVSVIRTTWKHPFWDLTQHKWVKAGALRHGDHLRTSSGGFATVLGGTTPKEHAGWMWDLTVPGPHDFYIRTGTVAVLVHNCPAGPLDNNYPWPRNNGFENPSVKTTLPSGYQFDRYGGIPATDSGRFASPAGTPFEMRALPPSSLLRPLTTYEVVTPIDAEIGVVRPWFGYPGGGFQINFGNSIAELLKMGSIRVVP